MIINADALEGLRVIPTGSVDTCVTSPPYFGLRDYGVAGQIGIEATPAEFVENLVAVFQEVRRVLKDDGTLWLNIGDSYAGSGKGGQSAEKRSENWQPVYPHIGESARKNAVTKFSGDKRTPDGIKPKDLIGVPWMLAFALRADGWYLRQDIIWHKPNVMPESVKDRCTKAHEYIFLLSKSDQYYFDNESIREPCSEANVKDYNRRKTLNNKGTGSGTYEEARPDLCRSREAYMPSDLRRNKRNVWTVNTKPYKAAHFATFPPDLIRPCILAGSQRGGVVLDPFFGAGTTGLVAWEEGRHFIGIDLNPEYCAIAEKRIIDFCFNGGKQ